MKCPVCNGKGFVHNALGSFEEDCGHCNGTGKVCEEKVCINIGADYDDTDQFICSRCGIHLQGFVRVELDEDECDETHHEYRLWYCPNCGARIKG